MKPGDLVRFSDDGTWSAATAGRIGLVTAVRQARDSKWHDFYFDAIVDGQLKVGCSYYREWKGADAPVVVIDEAR